MKCKRQPIKRIISALSPFPRMFSQLNPYYTKQGWVFPYYGHEDSKFLLAGKMVALFGLSERATTYELIEKFSALDKGTQRYIAYDLSHELKIASLAVSIALNREDSNVYEVGPCTGFSSFHYSRCIKEKDVPLYKPAYRLTAIEINEDYVKTVRKLKEGISKEFIAQVEFVHGDATTCLPSLCKDGDIVFSSMAQPEICECVLKLSNLRAINFVLSYGEAFCFKTFENSINSDIYDIFPFKDREFNIHVPTEQRRYGVVVCVHKKI